LKQAVSGAERLIAELELDKEILAEAGEEIPDLTGQTP
jgi:ATP-dependent exoDNAse (exonuclease V) alpha subunit